MDYQTFFEQLPSLYENWEQGLIVPKSDRFEKILNQVTGMTTVNVMQLLNFAVECLEPNEVYCEIGCFQGASLIAALLDRPEPMAYAVDNFSEFDAFGDSFDKLTENLSRFNLLDRVFFSHQEFEHFFCDLRELETEDKIGLYFYDAAGDYRSHLMGLLLVKSFLAERSLLVLSNSNWDVARQANWDFVAAHPQCKLFLDLTSHSYQLWNGLQVFVWDAAEEHHYNWESSQKLRNRSVIKLLYEMPDRDRQIIIGDLYKEAINQHRNTEQKLRDDRNNLDVKVSESLERELLQVAQKYQALLRWDSTNANVWLNLGIIFYVKEQYREALDMLLKSVELDPSQAIAYYSMGLVLEKVGDVSQAIQAYLKTIQVDPQETQAYNNLGNILYEAGEIEQAESIYRQAIAVNTNHFGSYVNLGKVMLAQQQVDAAIAIYQKALELKPGDPNILNNLEIALETKKYPGKVALYSGQGFYRQGKYEAAIGQFQKFLETQVGDLDFYRKLAICYEKLNQYEAVIQVYQQAAIVHPQEGIIYFWWILTLQAMGRTQDAIALASKASRLLPDDLSLKREEQLILPILYENPEEIHFYRQRFTQGLENFSQQISLESYEARKKALIGISRSQNFYLQYQGFNDLELQQMYGQLVHQIAAANYPEWAQPLTMPPLSQNSKIRIGYVSNFMYAHTVSKLYLGWLPNCNFQKFEVHCYYINQQQDTSTQKFRLYSNAFYHIPGDLEAVCQQIIRDQLHVLVFLEIGMHPQIIQMAALRLAPVQCVAWGHPITSGLPTIDYFISSDLMEPENAEQHYSEQLIRLPNIGISYNKPAIPQLTKTRADFQLRQDTVVYLCCQSLFKYLPQYDGIFAEIARQVPQAQFVFLSHASSYITEKFRQRLQYAFAKWGLNSEDYCLILPQQDQVSYWYLNLVSDIYLDTFAWSGGNTTLEAIACNLPVVTCPGEFMRGRHSYGILKMLGVTETIAKNEAEYIEIAVKLGLDPEWRKTIVQEMIDRHPSLYDDKTCVQALEAFYERVLQEYQF
ncbi:O-linked N-acetylglucosamine transferase family protein [Microcoleus sp. MON2_D5]|uniref:O-linked N-acetylglucosamine transferase family protein n=1 Tax=Microcoleus sp. MON2_D5 TaxID=2818833 RepID=UPI002FD3184C